MARLAIKVTKYQNIRFNNFFILFLFFKFMSEKLILAKKIYSLDKPNEFFTAMVIKDGRIIELTDLSKIDLKNYNDVYDYGEYFIIPGFNDSHIHTLGFGHHLENIDLVGCSKQDLIDRVRIKVRSLKPGEWILGRGWDQENFEYQNYPSAADLDNVSPNNPVLLNRICGHICLVNSYTLKLAGISSVTENPEGGLIDKNLDTNQPTGILRETAMDLVDKIIPKKDNELKKKFILSALKELNKKGITSIQTNDGNIYDLYLSLKELNLLTMRVYLTPMINELSTLIEIGAKSNQGDDFLRWGRIKIFSDGSLGAETAALFDNYENSSSKGILIHSPKILYDLVSNAHNNGWQLETHAIGDLSAETVVSIYEQTGAWKNRPVLTHCQILNESIINKMNELNIIANIQPIFINTDLHWAEKKIGKKRMKFSYAWKTLLNSNVKCCGGSDAPVEKPDTLLGIHAAVNRQDNTMKPEEGWYPEQSLTIWEAVKLFTVGSAYAEFQEKQKGKLLPNFLADFIVLDKDIFNISKKEISSIKIRNTFVNGDSVYQQ
jgi:hypothetical protein